VIGFVCGGIAQLITHEAGESIVCREGWRRDLPKWLWGGLILVVSAITTIRWWVKVIKNISLNIPALLGLTAYWQGVASAWRALGITNRRRRYLGNWLLVVMLLQRYVVNNQRSYHSPCLTSSQLTSFYLNWMALWSDSVCRGCDQSEQAYWLATCLRHVSEGWSLDSLLASTYSHRFSVARPTICNSLPPAVRMCTSPDTFRRHLKTHCFKQAFRPT